MAGFSGGGVFSRVYSWVTDKAAAVKITASRFDDEDGGIADGLSNLLLKDGQQTTTGPISFAAGAKVSDGSSASAAVAFINDGDTGIWRIGANNIAIQCGGTRVVDFSTSAATGVVFSGSIVTSTPRTVALGGTGVSTTDSVRATGAATNIATASATVLDFTSEDHDTDAMHSTGSQSTRLTAVVAGTYFITGSAKTSNSDGLEGLRAVMGLRVLKNGATYLAEAGWYDPGVGENTGALGFSVATIAQLAADDYVELVGFTAKATGATTFVALSGISPVFSMVRVSA